MAGLHFHWAEIWPTKGAEFDPKLHPDWATFPLTQKEAHQKRRIRPKTAP